VQCCVMPALRSRANKCIRDRLKWGRYAGVVIEGKMHEGVQHKIAVVCVYSMQHVAKIARPGGCGTRIAARWVHGGGGWRLQPKARALQGMGQTYSVAEEVAARVCARGAPPAGKKFVTYRANGKIDGVTN
jgi:hypothetical protein